MAQVRVVTDAVHRIGSLVSGGLEVGLFALGAAITPDVLYMAAPTEKGDRAGRRRWAAMLVLVALRKTQGWDDQVAGSLRPVEGCHDGRCIG